MPDRDDAHIRTSAPALVQIPELGRLDPDGAIAALTGRLAVYHRARVHDPQINPVKQLAHDVSVALESTLLSREQVGTLITVLTARAVARAASTQAARLRTPSGRAWSPADIPRPDLGEDVTVSARHWAREQFGIVFTGHPTFRLARRTRTAFAATVGRCLSDPACTIDAAAVEQAALVDGPDDPIDLQSEAVQAEDAIEHFQDAYRPILHQILDQARSRFPEAWRAIRPKPVTVASWIGYDVDGRTDIAWWDSFRIRLDQKRRQLERYRASVKRLAGLAAGAPRIEALLAELETLLQDAASTAAEDARAFAADLSEPGNLARAANALTDPVPQRVRECSVVLTPLDQALDAADPPDLALGLAVLRAEITTYGLGTAHIHLRINASQLHNAIRAVLGLDGEPDDPGTKRAFLNRIQTALDDACRSGPETVNFASLSAERSTARRQMILAAQILKHIDGDTPIRFLIAECETPFTLLTALYFAKLFGVEDRLDISPLFETPAALEQGAGLIERLLENPHYRAYVAARGRLCIQTGFSDAGRFLGQIPATLAIERLQMKLASVITASGIGAVEVVIFNTHGESMGRGCHPGSLADRLDYALSPAARARFDDAGIPIKHEVSIQGGDGFTLFTVPALARATLNGFVAHQFAPPPKHADPFYQETDTSLDFFLRIKAFHERCIDDPDYAALLGTFSTHMLHKTGSRVSKRQHDGMSAVDRGHPSQIRAIPHNAILQQLGYPANVITGLGTAARDDIDRFGDLIARSARARHLLAMVAHARARSSLTALSAYVALVDPGYWISRAAAAGEGVHLDCCRQLASALASGEQHTRLRRIINSFRQDAIDLDRLARAAGLPAPDASAEKAELELLHGLRIALIQHLLLMGARVPRFSERHDLTRDQIFADLLALDVPAALKTLRDAFPADPGERSQVGLDEPASYSPAQAGYRALHETLFEPIDEAYALIRRISGAIAHTLGAHG